jgi:peptide/nickel transport system substrate-binding protein
MRKRNCVLAVTLLGLWALGLCVLPGPSNAKELVVADILLPTSCDPAVGADVVSRAFFYAAYEPLLRYKPGTTELEPCLAESYEASKDGLKYTLNLRKNVKFQDGSPFNAEAVKFSIERIKKINRAPAIYVATIKSVDVIDANKVGINLEAVDTSFPQRLPMVYIVSPKYVKDHEQAGDLGQKFLNENMMGGTGPYYMDKLVPNEYAVLAKYKDYWRGWKTNNIDQIIWRQVKESTTRRLMLEKGDIQVSNRLAADDLVALEKNPNIKIAEAMSFTVEYLRMNVKKKPFDDIRVRRAMAYALNYKGVIEQVQQNHASPLYGPMPKGLFGHNDTLKSFEQDMTKAKKFLEEAGYKPGQLSFTFVYLKEQPFMKTIGELLQSDLREIGVDMKMQETTWVTLLGMVKDPETTPQMFDGASGDAAIDDSVEYLTKQFHSKSTAGASWNQNWYINPKVDELLDKAKVTVNADERARYLKEVQSIVYEDLPQLFIFREHTMKPMLKSVMGYVLDPLSWGQFNFYDMYIQ